LNKVKEVADVDLVVVADDLEEERAQRG